jgi:Outer membrane protein beta-barrel domain
MRSAHALLLSAAAFAVLGAPLRAQQLWTFSINPSFGANLYLSKLPTRFNIRGKENDIPVQSGNLTNIVTMRNSLGVRYGRFVGVEAIVSLSPSNLQSNNLDDMSVDIISYGMNASFYVPLGKPGRELFLSGGYGLKRYDFFYFRTWSENAWTWNLGTGANLPITNRIAVHLEARDHVSTFNSNIPGVSAERQNDLTVSIGLNLSVNSENR